MKALPQAHLVVPDGEVIRTDGQEGSRLRGNTLYSFDVRTNLDADAIFKFYRDTLATAYSWPLALISPQDSLLAARGRQGDFAFLLRVSDPKLARTNTDRDGHMLVYHVTIVAEGKKGVNDPPPRPRP